MPTAPAIEERDPPAAAAARTAGGSGATRRHWIAFALCIVFAFVFTLPKSLAPAAGLLGYPGDNFQHAWFLWHFARALLKFQNPFYTSMMYYPATVNLAWSTTDPLAGMIALPASLLLGPVLAYNFSLILQLALAAFFARLLCLRVCRNEAAAFIGGVCFGFSPFLMAHALGHLSLVTAFPIPLYFLALDRLLRNSKARSEVSGNNALEKSPAAGVTRRTLSPAAWKDGLLLGLALLLTALAHYNYTFLCLAATPVVIAADAFLAGPRLLRKIWRPLAWASAVFLATFSPILIMLIGNAADKPQPRTFDHIRECSADVLGFLIPSWNHTVLGNFARSFDPRIFAAGYEGTVYVGPVILVLALVGFWKGRNRERRWAVRAAALVAIFYLISLGPALRIFGHQTSIPGPAALVYHIPWASFVSAPARFHLIAALGLAILVALGVRFLLGALRPGWQRFALLAAVGVLLLLDLLAIPFPVSSIADPAWDFDSYAPARACIVPSALQKGTLVTFPLIIKPYVMKSMWMQVSDRGRYNLVDGYLSYTAASLWLDYYRNPVLRSLLSLQGVYHTPVNPQADRAVAPAAFRDLNASAFIVFDSPQRQAAVTYLSALLQDPGKPSGSCTVFAVPSNH